VRLALAVGAAVAARALARAPHARSGTNFRGRRVSLAGGPALGVSASLAAAVGGGRRLAAPALVAGLGATAAGRFDDIVGARPEQAAVKGLRGHLLALLHGRVTAGTVKAAGLAATGLAAAALLPGRRRPLDVALAAGLIAGTANVVNLLDLRPGRALKAGLAVGLPLTAGPAGCLAAGPVGAAAGLLAADLDERVMLGDAGANGLGALLGLALAARTGTAGRVALLAGLTALTLASERVSFTALIDSTPWLRAIDRVGRRP
jgi:hypothetical protein